ncbi:hypothetical protein BLA13014_00800 [Burkholderia aenigmatica]|uniref:Uncharacterized protein n=1 Tax=Burkholderia aenigmatica TaxID=2015348 RepID=A0A6P2HXU5_9BURK|nr:hypothetical protein [Burkholderia aenigmatica]VWB23098.1 hypothetical protein BLA13014_00800 [Burkholderia aenigmatica]
MAVYAINNVRIGQPAQSAGGWGEISLQIYAKKRAKIQWVSKYYFHGDGASAELPTVHCQDEYVPVHVPGTIR